MASGSIALRFQRVPLLLGFETPRLERPWVWLFAEKQHGRGESCVDGTSRTRRECIPADLNSDGEPFMKPVSRRLLFNFALAAALVLPAWAQQAHVDNLTGYAAAGKKV